MRDSAGHRIDSLSACKPLCDRRPALPLCESKLSLSRIQNHKNHRCQLGRVPGEGSSRSPHRDCVRRVSAVVLLLFLAGFSSAAYPGLLQASHKPRLALLRTGQPFHPSPHRSQGPPIIALDGPGVVSVLEPTVSGCASRRHASCYEGGTSPGGPRGPPADSRHVHRRGEGVNFSS